MINDPGIYREGMRPRIIPFEQAPEHGGNMRTALALSALLVLTGPTLATESREQFTDRLVKNLTTYVTNNRAIRTAANRPKGKEIVVTLTFAADGSVSSATVAKSSFSAELNHKVEREMLNMPKVPRVPAWAVGKRYNLPLFLGGT